RRLWFLDRLEPAGSIAYNEHTAVRLTGLLNVAALEQSLNEIVRRHESLRTSLAEIDGALCQVIRPTMSLPLPLVDLSSLSEQDRAVELKRQVVEAARQPFNLSQGPLLRARLLRLTPTEHVLHIVIHHIIYDRWSQSLLRRELLALYQAFSAGRPSPLPELPIQYGDYAVWQQAWLQGQVLEEQLAYWKKQLGGKLPALDLPADRPRPPVQTFNGGYQKFTLSQALTQALRELSHRENVTLYMTLIAAFKTLLHRYTGQEDILIGSPIANRTRVEVEQLVGFFVNTLVLRTDFSGDPTFQTLLKRVSQMAFAAYAHQDLPFEKLVEELQPERDLSRHPIFQVLFVLKNLPERDLPNPPGLTVERFEIEHRTAKFDLSLYVDEDGPEIKAFFEYNTDLFEAATIERMIGHFQTLLEGIVADPGRPLSTLPLLTGAERPQLLVAWNDTRTDYPQTHCLHQLFEAQVDRTPDATAVLFEEDRLTYQQLDHKANQLAHHLRALGVGPETLVGIYMDRSVEMMVGLLGILKAGGAYVPLDPAFPPERIGFMLSDSQAALLLTQQHLVSNLPGPAANILCLDTDWPEIAATALTAEKNGERPAGGAKPDNLAYVIYTSGSTGKPKGVQIPHQAAVNFLTSMAQEPGLTPDDVLLAVTTLSFDIALLELFLPLIRGAQVVIASRAIAADGQQLQACLDRTGATVLQATPATYRLLLEAGWQGHSRLKILCGGEALPQDLARRLLACGASLWNMYGPTETTVWSAVHRIEPQDDPISIGRPIANTEIYILDKHLRPVPVGITGELHIGGHGLARGYLNRPELTAEKFIQHPFSHDPAARIYKTGDLARYLPNGAIECLGRLDHQVKVRGYRIELGEIEVLLRQHPVIEEAVVVVRELTPGEKRLAAYLIAAQPLSTPELRSFLRDKLPEYMIPSIFVFLEALPLTPNGKVDRKALPAPHQAEPKRSDALLAPRDTLEFQISRIWAEVLGRKSIGVQDNFFEVGGHSLLAVRLFNQIEQLTGQRLPLATLFQAPTIEQLAKILRDEGWSPSWSSLVPIQPAGARPPLFFIHAHGGNVIGYHDLARRLGPDQPFYGLQARGLDGKSEPFARIEEMAAHYIKEIQTIQPAGPYFLGGYCMGGTIALEMAQQLQARGQKVGLVALLDTRCRTYYPTFLPGTTSFHRLIYRTLTRVDLEVGNFLEVESGAKVMYSSARIKRLWTTAQGEAEEMVKPLLSRFDLNLGYSQAYILKKLKDVHTAAYQNYRPQPYAGAIALFRAKKQPRGIYPDPTLGWQELVKDELQIYEVPGHRIGMLDEPRVRILGEQLKAALNDVTTYPHPPGPLPPGERATG
ncbi:MAG: amino acid adenylation domain-containing protein, partial [Chloroflexota bacterium]